MGRSLYSKILLVATIFSESLYAAEVEDLYRTVYMTADYGLGTYKSELMGSNDTNGVVSYSIGTYAGTQKQIGIDYKVETATTNFELNSSSLTMAWNTTSIKYRLWAFEFGPVIGSVTAKGNRAGTDIFDAVGSGYGGTFVALMPVGKNSSLSGRATQVSTGEMIDKKQMTVAIGPRLDLELLGKVGIAKKGFDVMAGYRRRTYTITEGGTSYAEVQTATVFGFAAGFDF